MEFRLAEDRARREFERDTVQAFQTIRIWILSHIGKGKLKLPTLKHVLPSSDTTAKGRSSGPRLQTMAELKAVLNVIAARTGRKIERK